ncbi:hypothetical protein ACKFKF_00115 [Phormidesmis sp. 146-12]
MSSTPDATDGIVCVSTELRFAITYPKGRRSRAYVENQSDYKQRTQNELPPEAQSLKAMNQFRRTFDRLS